MKPRYSAENFPKNLEIVDKLSALAEKKGATVAQVALAWILAQGDDFFVIPGTKRAEVVAENAGAGDVTLTEEEVKEIRKLVVNVAGDRSYPGQDGLNYGNSAPKV